MDYLSAYAQEVVSHYPEKIREEMFAEIYDELCEEYADWSEANEEATQAKFLEELKGHPIRYATRLAPEGQAYLIGPRFYYSFISAIKVAALVVAIVFTILAVITALASGSFLSSFIGMMVAIPGTLVWVFAIIAIVFVCLERTGEKASWLENWKAGDLKPVQSHHAIKKGETFFELALSLLLLFWILDVVPFPSVVWHDGAWMEGWKLMLPEWFFFLFGGLLVADIVFSVYKLTRRSWVTHLRSTQIVVNITWIGLLAFALAQPELIANGSDSEFVVKMLPLLNNILKSILFVSCLIIAYDTLMHFWRILKPGRTNGQAQNPTETSGV